jgi:hypothetical protein
LKTLPSSDARENLPLPPAEGQGTDLYKELDEKLNLVMNRVKLFYQQYVHNRYFLSDEKGWVNFHQKLTRHFKEWEKDLGDRGRDAIGYCNMSEFVTIDKAIEEENTANKEGDMKIVLEYQVGKKAKNSEGNLGGKYRHKLTWEFNLERLPIPVHVSSRRSRDSDDGSEGGMEVTNESAQTEGDQSAQNPTNSLETQGSREQAESLVGTTGTSNA